MRPSTITTGTEMGPRIYNLMAALKAFNSDTAMSEPNYPLDDVVLPV